MINKTSFEKRFTLLPPASGVISALLGLSVIIGWHTHGESLLQIIPSFVAMQYNTAIGFLLCGMGLVALAYGWLRLSTVAGSLVTALAILTLTEYIFGCDLGIDQLFMNHYITTGVSNPGRMAPNTAVCFLLTGISLLIQHRLFQYKYRSLTVAFLGTIIISLSMAAVFGYLSTAIVAYKWWNLTAMALHTAFGFLVLGTGVCVFAWNKSKDEDINVSRWTPILVGSEIALVSILFWQALLTQEHLNIERNVRQKTSSLQTNIEVELESRSLALSRLAGRWKFHGGTINEEWSSDANAYLKDYPELQALEWVNASFQACLFVSLTDSKNNKYPGFPSDEQMRVAFDTARNNQKAVVFSSIDLASGGKGFLLFTPLFVGNNFDGCILAVFNAKRLFGDILKSNLMSEYAVTIEDAQGYLYHFSAPDKRYQEDARQETSITFHNAQWKLRLRPSEKLLRESHSLLPPLILAVGFIVGSLFALIIYMNQKKALLTREIKDANQRLLVEIEERRQALLALQESEERYRNVLETMDEGFCVFEMIYDQDGKATDYRFVEINPAFEKHTGLLQALGKTIRQLVPNHDAHWFEIFSKVAQTGEAIRFENPAVAMQRYYDVYAFRVGGEGSLKVGAFFQDITKRKQTTSELQKLNETLEQRVAARVKELEETKEQLYHAQKMESIGKLAGGVAHDFNNILMAIMGYANLAESELPEDNPARVFIQKLLNSIDKATKITQSLLAFSRKQPVSMTSVSLNKIVETVGFLLPKIAHESIKCHLSVNTRDCAVLADADKIEQVLMNITNNAVDAMPNGGNLTISTGTVDIDHAFAGKYGLENAGPYSTITISDTGTGMDEETQRKIFEPFFTTKVRGKGTGLGLPIAYGIIRQHNGHIAVSSEPNKGTTFTIYLPLTEKPILAAVSETTAGTRDASHSGSETILLAEDERGVRDVITNVLERKGYRVIVAVDGEDAVVKFKENLGVIQMLVFDVMMPNKDGKEAYNAIKQIKPNAKILFLSGYSEDIDTNKTINNEGLPFIQKPIKADKLLRKVREILDT